MSVIILFLLEFIISQESVRFACRVFIIQKICNFVGIKLFVFHRQDELRVNGRKELTKAVITTFPVLKDSSLPIGCVSLIFEVIFRVL